MRRLETRRIGPFEVTTQQLPAPRAFRLAVKLGKIVAPLFEALRGKSLEDFKGLDLADLAPALSKAFAELDAAQADALALEVLAATSVVHTNERGQLEKIDLTSDVMLTRAFTGEFMSMLMTIGFALEVNFRDFFSGSAQPAPVTPTPSP